MTSSSSINQSVLPNQSFVPKDKHPDDINTLDLIDQYDYYYEYYKKKYGEQTTILFQNGSFYEFYGIDNGEMKIGCVKEMCSLLPTLTETCQDKKKPGRNTRGNHLIAGFPTGARDNYIDALINSNYVVVQIDQCGTKEEKKDPKDKLPRRVTAIHSPGTYMSENEVNLGSDPKYLVQIYLEGYYSKTNNSVLLSHYQPMSVGLSAIDITTGECDFYEVYNNPDDSNYALDEIYRYLQTHQPTEILISTKDFEKMNQTELESYLDLRHNMDIRCQINFNQVPKSYFNRTIQENFLIKIYPNHQMLHVFEYLDLEMTHTARISFLMLLQFAYEHNDQLIKNLRKPDMWEPEKYLILANNAISQLDLVNGNRTKVGSIFNLINFTSTNMGRRLLKSRLLNPLRNTKEIEKRYQMTDHIIETGWKNVEKLLTGIYDLERLHRRIELGTLPPMYCNHLIGAYQQVQKIIEIAPKDLYPTPDFPKQFEAYMKHLEETLDLEETTKYLKVENIIDNIFCPNYAPSLDRISEQIRENHRYLDLINQRISDYIPNSSVSFNNMKKKLSKTPQTKEAVFTKLLKGSKGAKKMEKAKNDKLGYHFRITVNRFTMFEEVMKNLPNKTIEFKVGRTTFKFKLEDFEIISTTPSNSHHYITTPKVKQISQFLLTNENTIQEKIQSVYLSFLNNLEEKYGVLYHQISHFTAEVDLYKSQAKCQEKYNYCRPKILTPTNSDSSYLKTINCRHPIVERITTNSTYIPHSLQFGIQSEEDSTEIPKHKGYLLYGTNACGKSTSMKAVGVNLIMAQAGFYVAAESFEYLPYHNILTRILGNDNMFRGLSSFAVEMTELRGILARLSPNSLVLGDEVCNGTETTSGMAIVAATLERLLEEKSHFIFATHLHQLYKIPEIQAYTEKNELGVYHLKVIRDPKTNALTYDRNLNPGPGDSYYGVEVARAMGLQDDLISRAIYFRKCNSEYLPEKQDPTQVLQIDRKSRYNTKKILDRCEVCEKPATDTHHIRFQSEANDDNFIDHIPKNHIANLVALCKNCHTELHHGKLEIRGYQETSEGVKLDYNWVLPNISKKSESVKKSPNKLKLSLSFKPLKV